MKRKQVILIAILAVLLVGGISSYFVAKNVLYSRAKGWKAQGLAAAQAGDNARAADLLLRYIRRFSDDLPTIDAYVKAREAAPLPNGQHIFDTIGALKLLLGQAPDRVDARLHLLELYARLGRGPESLDTAKAILGKPFENEDRVDYKAIAAKFAADPVYKTTVLRTLELKTQILTQMSERRQALAAAEIWMNLDPENLRAHIARISLRADLDQAPVLILKDAEALRQAHPNDPRFELLQGFAFAKTQNQLEAAKWLRLAASHDKLDDDFAKLLVTNFDALSLSKDSLAFLEKVTKAGAGADLRHTLARRYWQIGDWKNALTMLDDVKPADPRADATLLALKAFALTRSNDAAGSKACRDALAARTQSPDTKAWTLILPRLIDSATVDDKAVVAECRNALALDPDNSYLSYFLGDANARLGELDLAIDAWTRAAAANSTWTEPGSRLVEALLQKGSTERAMEVAGYLARNNPENASAVITLARAYAAGIENGLAAEKTDDLLKMVTEIQEKLPNEEKTLIIQVQLSAQKGLTEQSVKLTRAAIARKPAPSEQVFLSLSAISRKFKLNLENEIFAACEAAHGLTPRLAYSKAVDRSIASTSDEGLKAFDEMAQRAGRADDLPWRLARVQYLDISANPQAKAAWVALGDANPDDLPVQQGAANARATRGDWDFMPRTIDRLKKLTGDKGLAWKLAKARLLVESARNEKDSEDGAKMLREEIINANPNLVEPHVLLARALAQLKRTDGAIEQLTQASKLDPTSIPVGLQLAALLQSRGDFERVRQELDRVAPHLHSSEQAQRTAALMAQQGDPEGALRVLEQMQAEGKLDGTLLQAALYRQRGQLDKAEPIVKKLLEHPDPTTILFAASMYGVQGRINDAEEVLKKLDELKLDPGVKELAWTNYDIQIGNFGEAIKHATAATEQAPRNAVAWKALATCLAAVGKNDEAISAIDNAARAIPEDKGFATLKQNATLLRSAAGIEELRPIVLTIMRDPLDDTTASLGFELLGIVIEGKRSNELERVSVKLRQMAERNPKYLPAQIQLALCYVSMGRPGDAIATAQRATAAFPSSAEPAKLTVQLCASAASAKALSDPGAAASHWQEMLTAAQLWKKRATDGVMGPDIAAARAQAGLKQYDVAVQILQPYVAQATGQPDRYPDVLIVYAQALANSGQAKAASDLLWPLAAKLPSWRAYWVQVAADLTDSTVANEWLDRAAAAIPPDAIAERLVLAKSCNLRALKLKDAKLGEKATLLFTQLAAQPNVTAEVLAAAGVEAEQRNDLKAAESLYRQALQKNPDLWVIKNNLAMVILHGGGDLKEATRLGSEAVQSRPNIATLYDTMAQIYAQDRKYKSAVDSMRTAIRLEPDSAQWRVRLAQYLLADGASLDAGKAIASLDSDRLDVRSLPQDMQLLLADLRKQTKPERHP